MVAWLYVCGFSSAQPSQASTVLQLLRHHVVLAWLVPKSSEWFQTYINQTVRAVSLDRARSLAWLRVLGNLNHLGSWQGGWFAVCEDQDKQWE